MLECHSITFGVISNVGMSFNHIWCHIKCWNVIQSHLVFGVISNVGMSFNHIWCHIKCWNVIQSHLVSYQMLECHSITFGVISNVGMSFNHIWYLVSYQMLECHSITFKEYLKLLNRLYDITWFGSVYA